MFVDLKVLLLSLLTPSCRLHLYWFFSIDQVSNAAVPSPPPPHTHTHLLVLRASPQDCASSDETPSEQRSLYQWRPFRGSPIRSMATISQTPPVVIWLHLRASSDETLPLCHLRGPRPLCLAVSSTAL
ncbi:hypothetical protein V8B97DRAFT_391549 [Scleroderma yunnanense]